MTHGYAILKYLSAPKNALPYWLIEIYPTADGFRTRILDDHYFTYRQAQARIKQIKSQRLSP